jgi:hypothetical protein
MSADQHKQIGIRRGARSFQLERCFYEAKLKVLEFTGIKGTIRKIKKPVAALSEGLDYRPIPLSRQIFRETVPLIYR